MNWDKTDEAAIKILRDYPEEKLKEILEQVRCKNHKGITYDQYLENFENEYSNQFDYLGNHETDKKEN